MVLVSRIVAVLILGIAGYQLGENTGLQRRLPGYADIALNFGVLILLGAVLGWFVGGLLGQLLEKSLKRFSDRAADRSGSELVVGTLGLIVGLAVSALLSVPVSQLDPIGPYLLLPMTLIISYVASELAAAKHGEILGIFGARIDVSGAQSKLLDTSAIIDGRIGDVAEAGFIEGDIVVPVFVLEELQSIADSSDDQRRARGRRGLEVVRRLRKAGRLSTIDDDPTTVAQVDSKLVRLAQDNKWAIVTTDFNLQRVAQAQEVNVLNVNELANSLKPDFVPGDEFELKVIREGKEQGQGVGYLDDGTMVIVEKGRAAIGEVIPVEVASVLQSPSGKLVFTRVARTGGESAGGAS